MRYNNLEKFLNSIKQGKLCTGCCITCTDPAITEIAAEAGFDFCWIDGEHGVMDRNTAMVHIMALKGTDCAPFYRVPACDHAEIKKIIDFAPAGIIVPMIMNEEDARYAVESCRYPLTGTRGCGYRRGNCYGSMPIPEYFAQFGEESFRQVETEVISEISKRSGLVISTGGGCVTRLENYPLLHQNGRIIWIKRNLTKLPTDGCPLSQSGKLEQMYALRKPLYETFADITIDNDATVESAIQQILKLEGLK